MKQGISILIVLGVALALWLLWRNWPTKPAKSEVDEMLEGFDRPPRGERP